MRIPFSIKAINSVALIIFLLLFILFIQTKSSDSMLSPLNFPPETYSIKIFDDNAPFCQVEGEPCGFFDISLNGNIHFDWIKSWCRCPATHECLFVEHDLRHKVYKFACMRIVEQKYLYGNGQSSRSRNRIIVSRSRHGRRRSVK